MCNNYSLSKFGTDIYWNTFIPKCTLLNVNYILLGEKNGVQEYTIFFKRERTYLSIDKLLKIQMVFQNVNILNSW